jgi:hypothetical protein
MNDKATQRYPMNTISSMMNISSVVIREAHVSLPKSNKFISTKLIANKNLTFQIITVTAKQ